MESAGERGRLGRVASRAVESAFLFATLAALLLFLGADGFGVLLYDNADVGRYVRMLAPLVPVMYLDSVVDAHLKGLGHQVYSMGVNIADAAISVLAVLLLLPILGADGYALVIYVTELFNFALSLGKLRRVVSFSLPHGALLSPLLAAFLSLAFTSVLLPVREGVLSLVTRMTVGGALFLLTLLFLRGERKKTEERKKSRGSLGRSGGDFCKRS
jgi:O-antigen/teichoic acid export membrane protein